MMKNFVVNVIELFVILFLVALTYNSYLFVYNINVFPPIEVNIAYYFFLTHYKRKSYIYLIFFDLVLEYMIFTNIFSYLFTTSIVQNTFKNNKKSDIRRLTDAMIFTLIFLTTRYIFMSVYELKLFNYVDILFQVITVSLLYPLIETLLIKIDKLRTK